MINIGNFNIYPNDIDYVKLEQQGLCKDGNLNDTYFKLYNTYLSLFYDILNDNGLNSFDNDLENSNLHFNQVEKEDMDMYQSNSIFKYFYVRNNLYLEKLSNEDIENLLSNDSNKKDIALRTFKDIINIDDGYKVCYGPDTDNFWYDSDILVLGFRFLEFSDNGLSDEAWEEEFYKKRTYLNNMFSSLEASLTEKLGLKVKICEYDEYSIINNKNIEK